jgi:hypothetical protein
MKAREIFNELKNLNTGSLSTAISSEDEYAKITIYVSLLVHKNIQYSRVYLGDKLLGTINKYRYQKVSDDSELNEEDYDQDATNLFSSMLNSYLTKIKVTDTVTKTLIILLVFNNKIQEFRNVNKLANSEWGVKMIEFIGNLGINSKMLMDSFLSQFDEYPIHKEILRNRIQELMFTNNCRERYYQLMKEAWNEGELTVDDPKEQEFFDSVLILRSKVRLLCSNIELSELLKVMELPKSTYGNKKRELIAGLSKYYYNSIYSNLIDLISSFK